MQKVYIEEKKVSGIKENIEPETERGLCLECRVDSIKLSVFGRAKNYILYTN